MIFSVIFLFCSILIVNRGIVSPTLHVNKKLFVIPYNSFWGIIDFTIMHLQSPSKAFSIQNSIIYDNISPKVADKRKHRFGPTDELTHHP